jgi:multiple sugar transport system substrate-binding protein
MRKHFIIYIGIFTMILLTLSACGSGKTSQPGTGNLSTDKKNAIANESADLVIFSPPAPEEVWNERFGNALKKKFPNYKITYIQASKTNSLSKMIASGEQVDLIFDSVGGAANSVIANHFQYDLSELVKKHHVDLSRFEPTMLDAVKQFGGLYGFPLHSGGLVLYYNKDIFDKFGVPYPKDGMTWEEAIELGKRLTRNDNGRQYIGLGPSISHLLSMNSYSLPFVDKSTNKAAINNDNYKKLVQTLAIAPTQTPGYREKVASIKRTFNNDDFMKEKFIAMYIMNFGLQGQKGFEDLNWDIVSVPVFKDNPGVGTQPYPNILFVTSTSKYKDQAMEVLKFLTSDEHQMALSRKGYIPVLKNEDIKKAFAQDSSFKDKNVVKAVFTNKFAPSIKRTKYDGKVTGNLLKQITQVILGEEDLNTALKTAEEEANKAIEAEMEK